MSTPYPPGPALPEFSFRLTREGWLWLAAPAVLWGIGLYKGINLLNLIASLLAGIWVVNLVTAARSLRRLGVRRAVGRPVFARTPVPVEWEIDNTGGPRRFGIRVEDRGGVHRVVRLVSRLEAGERLRLRGEVELPARGRYVWKAPRLWCGYPFGLAEGRMTTGAAEEVIVFPELGRLHRGRLRHFLDRAAPPRESMRRRLTRHPAAQAEFHGLRTFRTGDSPRLIHWRTSARRGELMVREFEDTPTDNLVLVLEPWLPHDDGTGGPRRREAVRRHAEHLEDAISLAATVCWAWCRQTGDRLVLAIAGAEPQVLEGTTGMPLASALLEALALLEGTPDPNVDGMVERLASADLPMAPVLVVGTRPVRLANALALRLHHPVAGLDVSDKHTFDFFERAPGRALPDAVSH